MFKRIKIIARKIDGFFATVANSQHSFYMVSGSGMKAIMLYFPKTLQDGQQ
jgi:hypothetical protein